MAIEIALRDYDRAVKNAVVTVLGSVGFREITEPPNAITADWYLVKSPTPLITCILIYLSIVSWGIISGKRREGRKAPAWLWYAVQVHNCILIVLSAYMSVTAVSEMWRNNYKFWGTGFNPKEKGMAFVIWLFYVSKYVEFGDTLIMVAKGNTRQISFLHVYHHVTISLIWWTIVYVAPGGDAWYSCFLNSLVHVLMYTYYFIAAFLGKNEKAKKKYLWWGRYLTQFQMFQFLTMLAQAIYTWQYSPYPKFLSGLLVVYMVSLLALFFNFYVQKYRAPRQKAIPKEE